MKKEERAVDPSHEENELRKIGICTCKKPEVSINEQGIAICKKCGGVC